jgi:putative two-component system response regulator
VRLHDIGKIVITDTILNKPEPLTDEEFNIIKKHVAEGERIIEGIIVESGDEVFLQYAKLFAGYHHERWDGGGYPRGLSGLDIPLQGRVMAIADVYDALVSDRPYKKAFSHEEAVDIIGRGKGTQFDPAIADVFMDINGLFKKVHGEMSAKGD